MELIGRRIELNRYEVDEYVMNEQFLKAPFDKMNSIYLPDSMAPFTVKIPAGREEFIEDDNRGAIMPKPFVKIDGTDFYLSVKGIGSMTDPFSSGLLTGPRLSSIATELEVRTKLANSSSTSNRFITGELWLRGSPYGGQGLEHATIALKASEMADLTSIKGFNIAPVFRINYLPEELERNVKKMYWYRKFGGRIVQELRLVPSNIRIYFHSSNTLGGNAGRIFDLFLIDSAEKAYAFEVNLIRSGLAMLTLFSRTLAVEDNGMYSGLDFYDVWLDKDAVIAPDGTIYFVDLEGIERISVPREKVMDKIDEQIFRSLYEFMFAYEQIDQERARRFGGEGDRRTQFEILIREALLRDDFIRPYKESNSLKLEIRNCIGEERLNKIFNIIDW